MSKTQDHVPLITSGKITCEECGEPRWDHKLPAADCPHPAALALGHADNPSRFQCGLCDTAFVDSGTGYQPVVR